METGSTGIMLSILQTRHLKSVFRWGEWFLSSLWSQTFAWSPLGINEALSGCSHMGHQWMQEDTVWELNLNVAARGKCQVTQSLLCPSKASAEDTAGRLWRGQDQGPVTVWQWRAKTTTIGATGLPLPRGASGFSQWVRSPHPRSP